jgi:hypothetical protein
MVRLVPQASRQRPSPGPQLAVADGPVLLRFPERGESRAGTGTRARGGSGAQRWAVRVPSHHRVDDAGKCQARAPGFSGYLRIRPCRCHLRIVRVQLREQLVHAVLLDVLSGDGQRDLLEAFWPRCLSIVTVICLAKTASQQKRCVIRGSIQMFRI